MAVPSAVRVAGIGASAGGLDAFLELVSAIPVDAGLAFVLIQHLDPRHHSMLVDILSGATSMQTALLWHRSKSTTTRIFQPPDSARGETHRTAAPHPGAEPEFPVGSGLRSSGCSGC